MASFNRYYNLKTDGIYNFKISIFNHNGELLGALIQITGHSIGSSLAYAYQNTNIQSAKYQDRLKHKLIYKHKNYIITGKYTGGYDDVYLILNDHFDINLNESPDTFNILTYNVWQTPYVSSANETRLFELPKVLKNYDVILFQELFYSSRGNMLAIMASEYPYQSAFVTNNDSNMFDGGIKTISRYPILEEKQWVFNQCTGADCVADKGIMYTKIDKHGHKIHIFNTHLSSTNSIKAKQLRLQQFSKLREVVITLQIPEDETIIFAGDLNVDKLNQPDEYQNMLRILDVEEPTYASSLASFNPKLNLFNSYSEIEHLDYILISNNHKKPLSNINRTKVLRSHIDALWGYWDLSDHFPIYATLNY